jgi:carboxymethylenebutenolidase
MDNPYPHSYLATPGSGKGPGVLVVHAWWGLNQFMREFCNRLASEGFVVLAPDLYQGEVATTIDEAKHLRSRLKQKQTYLELLEMIDSMHSMERITSHTIGLVGFSLGARFALELSVEYSKEIYPVIVFYGNSNVDYSGSQAAYLGHFAEKDEYVALSGLKKLEKNMKVAGRPFTAHIYKGTGHWFFEKDRVDAYDEQAAQLAWERTIDFLDQHLKA